MQEQQAVSTIKMSWKKGKLKEKAEGEVCAVLWSAEVLQTPEDVL